MFYGSGFTVETLWFTVKCSHEVQSISPKKTGACYLRVTGLGSWIMIDELCYGAQFTSGGYMLVRRNALLRRSHPPST